MPLLTQLLSSRPPARKRVLLIFSEQFSANFDFSSCPRQTGLAKPRPFSAEAYSGSLRAAEQKRPSMIMVYIWNVYLIGLPLFELGQLLLYRRFNMRVHNSMS